jgi:hypothetical protein
MIPTVALQEFSHIVSSRGDTKPCTAVGCDGRMRFGRRSDNDNSTSARVLSSSVGIDGDERGWTCSASPDHFRREGSGSF